MIDITSVAFVYKNQTYYALLRKKTRNKTEYHITVMNGTLEKLIYGCNVITEDENGELHIAHDIKNPEAEKLVQTITQAFREMKTYV